MSLSKVIADVATESTTRNAMLTGPEAAVTRIFTGIIWLTGLAAVAYLWQKNSSVFFKTLRPR